MAVYQGILAMSGEHVFWRKKWINQINKMLCLLNLQRTMTIAGGARGKMVHKNSHQLCSSTWSRVSGICLMLCYFQDLIKESWSCMKDMYFRSGLLGESKWPSATSADLAHCVPTPLIRFLGLNQSHLHAWYNKYISNIFVQKFTHPQYLVMVYDCYHVIVAMVVMVIIAFFNNLPD